MSEDGDPAAYLDRVLGEVDARAKSFEHFFLSGRSAELSYVSLFNPVRALALVAAAREILELHMDINDGNCYVCVVPEWGYPTHGGSHPENWPCPTVRALATGWGWTG